MLGEFPQEVLDRHLPDASGLLMFGVPVEDLSVDQLKACLVFLLKREIKERPHG